MIINVLSTVSPSGASSCFTFASEGAFNECYPGDELLNHIASSNVTPYLIDSWENLGGRFDGDSTVVLFS